MDARGKDLWTAATIACPPEQAWLGTACDTACTPLPGTHVEELLDTGNGSWPPDDGATLAAFAEGTSVVVTCARGFEGPDRNWTLRCDGGTWSGEAMPNCTRPACEGPLDPVGLWRLAAGAGARGRKLYLWCHEGYAPADGSAVLACGDHARPDAPRPAVCRPAGPGDAAAWRAALLTAAMTSLASAAAVAAIILAVCWREQGSPSQETCGSLPVRSQGDRQGDSLLE